MAKKHESAAPEVVEVTARHVNREPAELTPDEIDRESSPEGSYPHRRPVVGDIVEYSWENLATGELVEQQCQVAEVYARHCVGLQVSSKHQNPVPVYFSIEPRPNTWRF